MKDKRTPGSEGDDVGTLLRLAGKRKPVSPERAERVRAATHARWQTEVRSRSRRRYVWAAAAVAAASLVLALVLRIGTGAPEVGGPLFLVESVAGETLVRDSDFGIRDPSRPARRSVPEWS